ncbi:MAG: SBBP repeat-containing protein, partial [Candidatus Syntrophosphaera sp.]
MNPCKGMLAGFIMLLALAVAAQEYDWDWALAAGGAAGDKALSVAADSSGNNCVTGTFQGTAQFGDTILSGNGAGNVFVARADGQGSWLWARNAGGTGENRGNAIALDGAGNVYVAGNFTGSVCFGYTTLECVGQQDVFIAKLDPQGNWLWAARAGGAYAVASGLHIQADSAGNAFISGSFAGNISFGEDHMSSTGGTDIFTARIDPEGNWLWAKQAGGSGADVCHAVELDPDGNILLAGRFEGNASFGPLSLTSNGFEDIFAAKLDAYGDWLWAAGAGGPLNDHASDIISDTEGDLY